MYHLVYTSSATISFKNIDVLNLLKGCRARNRQQGITGMLIYIEGNFIEALEGEETLVKSLFDEIRKDSRHHDLTILFEETFDEGHAVRSFPEWSMSLRNFHELQVANISGLNTFVQHIAYSGHSFRSPCLCWDLLRTFCESNH